MELTCKRCEYSWTGDTKHPKTCPRCKSYFWDKEYIRKPQDKPVKSSPRAVVANPTTPPEGSKQ